MLAGNGHAVLVNVRKVSLGMPFTACRKIVHSNFGLNFVLTFQRKPFMFGTSVDSTDRFRCVFI